MKKSILFGLTFLLLLWLCSCTVEAGPGEITLPTSAVESTKVTTPTGNTGVAEATEQTLSVSSWQNDVTRAAVPAPSGAILQYKNNGTTHSAWIGSMSEAEIMSYWQQILAAGFDLYHEEITTPTIAGNGYYYIGKNAEGIIVSILFGAFDTSQDGPSGSVGRISIQEAKELTAPPTASNPWGIDEFQRQLPEPEYSYTETQLAEYNYQGEPTRHYLIRLHSAMGYESCKAYGKILRESGFTINITETDQPFLDQYSFCAENESGYMVVLHSSVSSLMLFEPNMNGPGRKWDDDAERSYLPEPPTSNYCQHNMSYKYSDDIEIILEGMSYEEAKTYVDALKEKGYTEFPTYLDDPEAQRLEFSARGSVTGSLIPDTTEFRQSYLHVTLLYDPTYVLEDGTPYCIVRLE